MAQNKEDESKRWEQIEEQITCRMCGELFTDPRTLSCSHTFCKACLDTQVEGKEIVSAYCPLCLESFPQGGIATIPTNSDLNCLIKIFNRKEEKTQSLVETKCGKCDEDDAPVISWCIQCQKPLCSNCLETHKDLERPLKTNSGKIPSNFIEHWTVEIERYVQKPKPKKPCKKHAKQLEIYCKTCNSDICPECAIKGHIQHTFELQILRPNKKIPSIERKQPAPVGKDDERPVVINTSIPDKPGQYQIYIGKYDYIGIENDELSFKKGDLLYVTNNENDWWLARPKDSSKEGYIPRNYVAKYGSLESEDWFFGPIKRLDAEEQLKQPSNEYGSFLVRNSERTLGGYSLAVKDTDRVRHFKIHKQDDGEKVYIDEEQIFDSVQQLIRFYCKSSNGSSAFLKKPCVLVESPQTASVLREADEAWETERSSINFIKTIGPGQFGELWEGTWNNTTVAVKVQPDNADTFEFIEEAQVLKQLSHPCIIKLLAVCTKEPPIYIVTEMMEQGNLLEYLKTHTLKLGQKIDVATQVATGMAYLESVCVIHCDLAARNVLVMEDAGELVCKIANFGLAQFLSEDIYEAPSGTIFPPKWAAPEAAIRSYFSIKSDVWSFGILLYELITNGSFPYPGMSNAQVVESLETGYRMPRPNNCPIQLYKIMRDCWREDPLSRPTFETLQWRMDEYFINDS